MVTVFLHLFLALYLAMALALFVALMFRAQIRTRSDTDTAVPDRVYPRDGRQDRQGCRLSTALTGVQPGTR